MSPTGIFKIIHNFKAEHFYSEAHQSVAIILLHCVEHNIPIDVVSVYHESKKLGYEESVEGAYGISQIADHASSVGMIDYYHKTLFELYIKRQFIIMGMELQIKGYDDTQDVFDLIEEAAEKLEAYSDFFVAEDKHKMDDVTRRTIYDIINSESTEGFKYRTGEKEFDELIQFAPDTILLMGGKSGSGKTKFIIFLMSRLLKNYEDLSILWYAMEDPPDKILRAFLSQMLHLNDSELQGINYKMDSDDIANVMRIQSEMFEKWDIEFVNKPSRIQFIKRHFEQFCKHRPERLCILIIDNIMLIEDNWDDANQTKIDDKIAGEIKKISISTHQPIILVHHFTDAQLEKANLNSAYRPRESHLKGSTRYRDISTMIILWNNPSQYPDLIDQHKDQPWLDAIFLCDVTKNRNSRTGVLRWMGNLNTNNFYEL